jgi:hypothetical protein
VDDDPGWFLLSRPLAEKNEIVRAGDLAPKKFARVDYRWPIIRIGSPQRITCLDPRDRCRTVWHQLDHSQRLARL